MYQIPKPPEGVLPRFVWNDQREFELKEAIKRYLDGGFLIDMEWVEEYNELVKRRREDARKAKNICFTS